MLPAEVDHVLADAAACSCGLRSVARRRVQLRGHRSSVTSIGTIRKLPRPEIVASAIIVADPWRCLCRMSVIASFAVTAPGADSGAEGRGLPIEAQRGASIGNPRPMTGARALLPTARSARRGARVGRAQHYSGASREPERQQVGTNS